MERSNENPKVFISYSHGNKDFQLKIRTFSNRLRVEGIDAIIDQYVETPPRGWPFWMNNQIESSQFVLIICNKSFSDKANEYTKGKGVSWELLCIFQQLYDGILNNQKFIPIILDASDFDYVPNPLKSYTIYNISNIDEYDNLYWRLRGLPNSYAPELGALRPIGKRQYT